MVVKQQQNLVLKRATNLSKQIQITKCSPHTNFQLAQVGLTAKSLHPQTITLQSSPTWQMENMEALSVWTRSCSNHFLLHASFAWTMQTVCWLTRIALARDMEDPLQIIKWFLQAGVRLCLSYRLKPIPSEANQRTSLQPPCSSLKTSSIWWWLWADIMQQKLAVLYRWIAAADGERDRMAVPHQSTGASPVCAFWNLNDVPVR